MNLLEILLSLMSKEYRCHHIAVIEVLDFARTENQARI